MNKNQLEEFRKYAFHLKLNRDGYTRAKIIEKLLEKAEKLSGQIEPQVMPKIADTSYKPETPFRVCEDGTFNLVYNLRRNKNRKITQPEFINDITVSLSNNHHLTKEQMKEIAEVICNALNSNFSA